MIIRFSTPNLPGTHRPLPSARTFPSGVVAILENGGRRCAYCGTAKKGGGTNRRYVGPVDDPDIRSWVDAFKNVKADVCARRKLVSTSVREAYLPRPEPFVGDVMESLTGCVFFRLRGVLVGTAAYPLYSAILGARRATRPCRQAT
jgi:hypothetical protein